MDLTCSDDICERLFKEDTSNLDLLMNALFMILTVHLQGKVFEGSPKGSCTFQYSSTCVVKIISHWDLCGQKVSTKGKELKTMS